jgi:hypothetical protein
VTGIVYDVIDIDPRNGGKESFEKMSEALGDDGPEVLWKVKTPSGGLHLYVESLGIRKRKFRSLPGIDLQAGDGDGLGRGFVFLPPTVRKGGTYTPVNGGPDRPNGNVPGRFLEYIEGIDADVPDADVGVSGHRLSKDAYRASCMGAPAGGQRDALLRYVRELERRGYDRDDIKSLTLSLCVEMPTYDINRPWTPKDVSGLLDEIGAEGTTPDAIGEEARELESLSEVEPLSVGLIKWATDVEVKPVSWGWEGYLAFGEMTLLDGEKGKAKTFVCEDVTARATMGRAMPGCEEAITGPMNVIWFTDEGGHDHSVSVKRLMAAKADLRRVAFSQDKPPKRGSKEHKEWELALGPDGHGAKNIAARIRAASAELAIFDPITDYLASTVNTNNDAAVRAALRPLGVELGRLGCIGLALRHMNKNKAMEARFRGGGTTAFQNRSRVHLVMGDIPGSAGIAERYGIAMIDSNLTVVRRGVLAFSVEDSEIELDDRGNMVGCISWGDYVELSGDDLSRGESRKHGPEATSQMFIREILEEMFKDQETWSAKKVLAVLGEAGYKDHKTIDKVTSGMGIRKYAVRRHGVPGGTDKARGGTLGWYWTTKPKKEKVSVNTGNRN